MAQLQDRDILKAFDANSVEASIYKMWEESGAFSPEGAADMISKSGLDKALPGGGDVKDTFTITLPPPNANGSLHLGHTCGYSFHDAMGRFARMHGSPTLLLPGKDHASIQTEAVYRRILEAEGIDYRDLGREEFYKRCYEFCMEASASAQEQEKKIGLSADWGRDFFTLDPRLNSVIYETFYKMYDDGLVYRGKYIINQCPHCETALADVDTERREMRGIFAYIIYPFVDDADNDIAEKEFGHRGVMVATTRPETMLADTAVAVNPDDPRFKQFIGKSVRVPLVDRAVPIIADDEVDIESGTGALKVTPAHSPVDFEIGERHGLEVINVIDEKGKMVGEIPDDLKGLGTIDASKAIVASLDKLGLLDRMENIKHEVSVCERCGTPIEPIVSYQWFADMEPLAKKALEALDSGETTVIPDGQHAALRHFFANIKPWCISRQLWWGQRIPVWYSGGRKLHDWVLENPDRDISEFTVDTGDEIKGTGKAFLGEEIPSSDSDWSGSDSDLWFEPESDIFDTWFSSGQWPYSTLGGPEGEDFEKFYPTQVMCHARDILFWWSARMMMLGIYRTGKTPFKHIFLHGLIQAEDGSKMSKSRDNGVEPQEMFNTYGADALRMWYYTDALAGSNAPLQVEKIKGNRNFVNKIWNASRFIMLNIHDEEVGSISEALKGARKVWDTGDGASSRVVGSKKVMERIEDHMEQFRFHLAAETMRETFWGEFCDKWIEEVKTEMGEAEIGSEVRIRALSELLFLLKQYLKMMHPFMPYVTEAVWQELVKLELAEGMLIVEQW